MAQRAQEWRGLWHPTPPGQLRHELLVRAIVYLTTPLALALLFGETDSLAQFGRAYAGSFMVSAAIGGSFEVLYRVLWPRLVRRKPGWPARIAGHAATLFAAVGAGAAIAHVLASGRNDVARLYVQGSVISAVIITILVVTDETGARAREATRREAALRITALRAELAALQARTDPHFLFNSLNTVAALIPDDPELAETLLVRLATVFRYALDAGRKPSVALADELSAVTAYLDVEAMRLGSRLTWRLERDDGAMDVRVPPLVLQPLVENAIHHGAGGRRGPTEIVVTVRRHAEEIVLTVEDRGHAGDRTAGASEGTGTALADLRARLALAYADRARLEAGALPAPDDGWRARVALPVEPAA